jgi:hypothetical protein
MKRHQHDFRTLIETKNGYIGVCQTCNQYSIAYKNLLWSFEAFEIDWFEDVLKQKKYMYRFHTSHHKTLLHTTPLDNFFVLFEDTEIKEIRNMIKEVRLVVEARKQFESTN